MVPVQGVHLAASAEGWSWPDDPACSAGVLGVLLLLPGLVVGAGQLGGGLVSLRWCGGVEPAPGLGGTLGVGVVLVGFCLWCWHFPRGCGRLMPVGGWPGDFLEGNCRVWVLSSWSSRMGCAGQLCPWSEVWFCPGLGDYVPPALLDGRWLGCGLCRGPAFCLWVSFLGGRPRRFLRPPGWLG